MSEKLETTSNKLNITVARDASTCVNKTNIRLDLIDEFNGLEERQKKFLEKYATNPDVKTIHAMELGYSVNEVNRWFEQEDFSKVAQTIYDLFTEVLKAKDTQDAIENSKIRNRVIKARENNGKYSDDKSVNHNHLHTDSSLKDVLKMLSD